MSCIEWLKYKYSLYRIKKRKNKPQRGFFYGEGVSSISQELLDKLKTDNISSNLRREDTAKSYVPDRIRKENRDFIGTDGGSYTIKPDGRVVDKSNGKTTFKNIF